MVLKNPGKVYNVDTHQQNNFNREQTRPEKSGKEKETREQEQTEKT